MLSKFQKITTFFELGSNTFLVFPSSIFHHPFSHFPSWVENATQFWNSAIFTFPKCDYFLGILKFQYPLCYTTRQISDGRSFAFSWAHLASILRLASSQNSSFSKSLPVVFPISFHWTIMTFPICIIFVWMMLRQCWQCIFIRASMESDWGLEFGSRIYEIQVPQVKWTLETELCKAAQNGTNEISCCMYIIVYIYSCYGRYFFAHAINFQVEPCGNQRTPELL